MAVVTYDLGYISKKTGLEQKQIKDMMDGMGMPTEIAEGKVTVEVTPNRPDLLTLEGILRALNGYSKSRFYEYSAADEPNYRMEARKTSSRPFVVCAAVKDVKDTEYLYEEIMDAQEKMHETLGRKRKKAAIGIHDLDSVEFPLRFREVKEGKFIPLGMTEEMGIGEMLQKHEKGRAYAHLVEKGKYPVVEDSKGIISVPPIINCDRTKVKEGTRNFLIDITGTNRDTLEYVLNIVVCALADRGGKIFRIKVGKTPYPDLSSKTVRIKPKDISKIAGFEFDEKKTAECLSRMNIKYSNNKAVAPPYRKDISGKIDIIEDALIGYGYCNIEPDKGSIYHVGAKKQDVEREIFESMGFIEAKNFYLCDKKEYGEILPSKAKLLEISNPLTDELNAVKNTTVIELLKTVGKNKMKPLPMRFFEKDRVYDGKEAVELGFVIADKSVKIEDAISVVKTLFKERGIDAKFGGESVIFNDLYITGWSMAFKGKSAHGEVGVVKPGLLERFGLDFPVVCGFVREGG
jgi:phenylalanyl-tRNA synthetase beta chain